MKVLFRAQVANIGSLAEKFIKKLIEIDGRFYCIGFESLLDGEYTIIDEDGNCFETIYDTRAIHFENMIDLDKNKIFASLSKDGKGGDLFLMDEKYTLVFDGRLKLKGLKIKIPTYIEYLQKQKTIGIQK